MFTELYYYSSEMSPMRSRSSSGEVKEQKNSPAQEEFESEIKRTVVSRSRSRAKSGERSRSIR